VCLPIIICSIIELGQQKKTKKENTQLQGMIGLLKEKQVKIISPLNAIKVDWFHIYQQIQTIDMHAFNITITNNRFKEKHDQQYEDWVHSTYNYIYFLERTGQIVKTKYHTIIVNDNTIQVTVFCPEMDSLSLKYCSKSNLKIIKQIELNIGTTIKTTFVGRDADNPNYVVPDNSSFYILRNGWESPLLCGDTHLPIPLYKLPCIDNKNIDYDNINYWNRDYESMYGLWLSSGGYEAFSQEQLQDPCSSINKQGRELCKQIEKITNIPSYYFLFNYRTWTAKEDKERKCPITGNDWFIEGKTEEDFIAFKCDESRLVSHLSTNTSN
jgi:predicted  nucleic acid-binding Zn ribbon protein